jgi:hypothetical protein
MSNNKEDSSSKYDRYLSEDTELLTTTGWMNIRDITFGTLVAMRWPHGEIDFVKPDDILYKTVESAYKFTSKANTLSMIVSEDFNLIINGSIDAIPVREDNTYEGINFINSGHRKHARRYGLTYVERIKLAMNYLINNPESNLKARGHSSCFTLTNSKQIEHMVWLLEVGKIKYKKSNRLFGNGADFTIMDVDTSGIGHFENRYLKDWINFEHLSSEWCECFLSELSYWGGNRIEGKPDHYFFKNHCSNNYDLGTVQAIAALSDRTTVVKKKNNAVFGIDLNKSYLGTKGTTVIKEHIVKPTRVICIKTDRVEYVIRHNRIVSITSVFKTEIL